MGLCRVFWVSDSGSDPLFSTTYWVISTFTGCCSLALADGETRTLLPLSSLYQGVKWLRHPPTEQVVLVYLNRLVEQLGAEPDIRRPVVTIGLTIQHHPDGPGLRATA